MTTLRAIKNTKKARAALIFKELTDKGATRQQILDRLMAKLGITLSCASTYNQNFRSGFWNRVVRGREVQERRYHSYR